MRRERTTLPIHARPLVEYTPTKRGRAMLYNADKRYPREAKVRTA